MGGIYGSSKAPEEFYKRFETTGYNLIYSNNEVLSYYTK
jgi:hypothetical protein